MPNIVASLTTLPKRLAFISPTLSSLLNQTRPVSKIYLHIPDKTIRTQETYDEHLLQNLQNKFGSILYINRCGQDLGPITKIVPILDVVSDPNTLIFCADDDTIYKPKTIEDLYKCHLRNPNAVVGFGGVSVGHWPFHIQFVTENSRDVEVDWLQGVHGILYYRKFLDKQAMTNLEKEDPPELWYNDDHQLALYFQRKGIPRISCKGYIKDYIKYCGHNTVDALSGRRYKKMQESIKILNYMRRKRYYRRNYSMTTSIVFYILAFILLFILLCIGLRTIYSCEIFTGILILILLLVVGILRYNVY